MTLEKALENIEKMANGINPLTNEILPETSLLNNIEISRSLFCVLDAIKNEKKKNSLRKFSIDRTELEKFEYSDNLLSISEISTRINNLKTIETTDKLKCTDLNKWLVSNGMLVEIMDSNKKRKIPSEAGKTIGITTQARSSYTGGVYTAILYNKTAQKFIIDNFEDFLTFNKNS